MTTDKMLRQLEAVLDEERQHLLSGDLIRLTQLAKRKVNLSAALAIDDLPHDVLARFAGLSARNQTLLEAARDGLNAARKRLGEIQRGAPMGTYSREGEKSEYAKPVRTLQRRA
jgi:flagellar biosynthesis/type III secretory pathway chaperone